MIDSTNPNYITPFTLWGEVKYSSSTSLLPPLQDKLFSRNWHIWIWLDDLKHELMFYVARRQILVDCSGADGEEKTPEAAFTSKKSALLQLVDQRPVSKTIIFCNKVVYFVWTYSLVLISVASILALVSVFFHYWLSVQLFVKSISGVKRSSYFNFGRLQVLSSCYADWDLQKGWKCTCSVWPKWHQTHCTSIPCRSFTRGTTWKHAAISGGETQQEPLSCLHWQVCWNFS